MRAAGTDGRDVRGRAHLNLSTVSVLWVIHVQIDIPAHSCIAFCYGSLQEQGMQPFYGATHSYLGCLWQVSPCRPSGKNLSNKMNVHSA